METWLTPQRMVDLALPGLPGDVDNLNKIARRDWRQATDLAGEPLARRRAGKGGGWEYHYSVLPSAAQARLMALAARQAAPAEPAAPEVPREEANRKAAWDRYDALPAKAKAKAKAKLDALVKVHELEAGGMTRSAAVATVAGEIRKSAGSIFNWLGEVRGVERADWLPALAPHYVGRTATADVTPEAWEWFKGDFLRQSAPLPAECYQRLLGEAKKYGWTVPSLKTLTRRLEQIDPRIVAMRRGGVEAHDRLNPPQRRDRTVFHVMEALNYDGHKIDVFVKWLDGTVSRAVLLAFQDLRSGKIVGWRVDRSESAEGFRLAFGDVADTYGLPDIIYSDNTMAAAAKENTGGSAYRHRGKVKEDDFQGAFTAAGIEIRFTLPAHGQSKLIERSFGELSRYIAKAPECEGAYTGNNPSNKPSNYGSRAVPLDVLVQVCEREINRFNARTDRNGLVAKGRSYDEIFAEGYSTAPIRRLTEADAAMRRLWLLSAEGVRCHRENGHIELYGNRYWSECLLRLRGKKVAVRFDPDKLQQPLHVYRLDGAYVGAAECIADVGHADRDAARQTARATAAKRRATRDLIEAEGILDAGRIAREQAKVPAAPVPVSKVIRPHRFDGTAAVKVEPRGLADTDPNALPENLAGNVLAYAAAKNRSRL